MRGAARRSSGGWGRSNRQSSAPVVAKKGGPVIHYCAAAGCGAPFATCGIGDKWFCAPCAPADFWPANRGRA